ncbi:DEAD-domain-containing protein [Ascodesmis nigricans]|uniref:ATP-dependent RNA helicase n=1 Tax=Ascodesmis nigricans TaxID=341454 RepID=A0A4S2N6M8_9PEZI|nr:DEAD-domain-containing protein [Ascodesmis nigricans]
MGTIAQISSERESPEVEKKKSKKRKRSEEEEGKVKERKEKDKKRKEKKEKKEKEKKKEKTKKNEGTNDDRTASPADSSPPTTTTEPTPSSPSSKLTKKPKLTDPPTPPPEIDDASTPSGHSHILAKLRKSLARTALLQSAASTTEPAPEILTLDTPINASGLQPVPQPVLPIPSTTGISLTSSLPEWLRSPITVSSSATKPLDSIPGLDTKLKAKLHSQGITDAFAVQAAVLPLLLPSMHTGDVCISAATGSGKTLSYLLPVLQSLLPRVVVRLRAILVVPTRELVTQVHNTLITLSAGTGIKIGTAIGSRSLASEQSSLVTFDSDDIDPNTGAPRARSLVDVLITTPGRLVEHIRSTLGFELQFLRWLVVDEADRLLAQSFQEWVSVVIGGIEAAKMAAEEKNAVVGGVDVRDLGLRPMKMDVRKVVLSATMTRDVGKLAELQLREPALVVVEASGQGENGEVERGDGAMAEESYTLPTSLREAMLPIDDGGYKPLALLYLITQHGLIKGFNPLDSPSDGDNTPSTTANDGGVLIFTRSNESATRLSALLTTVAPTLEPITGLITGEMPKKRRERQLKGFRKGECQVLICSDLISRGLDLPNVAHIINYDVPPSVQAYVHRVGRTARAGKDGTAWTLVERKEGRWFMNVIGGKGKKEAEERRVMVKRAEGREVEKVMIVWDGEGEGVRGRYESVLEGGG